VKRTGYRILFNHKQILRKVEEIGQTIETDYRGKTPILIGILKGAFVFMADLVRTIEEVDMEIDFLGVSSYRNRTLPSTQPVVTKDLTIDIGARDVIVIEDIIDTGGTFEFIVKHIEGKNPSSMKICCLIDKRGRRKGDLKIDYVGFEIESGFIIGYGMDFSEKFRNIKDILLFQEEEA
jgi:hypoxanthine phosphoribosyltransferase